VNEEPWITGGLFHKHTSLVPASGEIGWHEEAITQNRGVEEIRAARELLRTGARDVYQPAFLLVVIGVVTVLIVIIVVLVVVGMQQQQQKMVSIYDPDSNQRSRACTH
jgi:hypothetical protein